MQEELRQRNRPDQCPGTKQVNTEHMRLLAPRLVSQLLFLPGRWARYACATCPIKRKTEREKVRERVRTRDIKLKYFIIYIFFIFVYKFCFTEIPLPGITRVNDREIKKKLLKIKISIA